MGEGGLGFCVQIFGFDWLFLYFFYYIIGWLVNNIYLLVFLFLSEKLFYTKDVKWNLLFQMLVQLHKDKGHAIQEFLIYNNWNVRDFQEGMRHWKLNETCTQTFKVALSYENLQVLLLDFIVQSFQPIILIYRRVSLLNKISFHNIAKDWLTDERTKLNVDKLCNYLGFLININLTRLSSYNK